MLGRSALLTAAGGGGGDPSFGSVSLLLKGDGANNSTAINDSSGKAVAITRIGNTKISTAQSKFGGSSIFFDGSSGLTVPNSASLVFGSGNFTIEFWVYTVSLTGIRQYFNTDTDSYNLSYAMITNGTSWLYYLSSTGSTWNLASGVSGGAAVVNTWQHVALVRSGNVVTPYINGQPGTSTTTSASLYNFAGALSIGYLGPHFMSGYIDEFRITQGIARYQNSFTPPTEAFPAF